MQLCQVSRIGLKWQYRLRTMPFGCRGVRNISDIEGEKGSG